jgi:thiamine biosynthesis lipoprotein
MDTVVDITIVALPGADLKPVWDAVDMVLKDWQERFSQTHERSEVLRMNERDADTVAVSAQLAEMVSMAVAYGDTLGGMFDCTILPVKKLWGFDEQHMLGRIPSEQELKDAMTQVCYKRITVNSETQKVAFSDTATKVDAGGMAKGFSLKKIAALLDSCGYSDYLIVAGGDIVIKGRRYDGAKWRIGIQHPRDRERLLAKLKIGGGSVVTSGDYERFWIEDGIRYHHIFNAATGKCCRANQSLTVWAPNPVEADILSTGLFCEKYQNILAFIEKRPRLECVVVDSGGQVHISKGWKDKVALID